MTWKFLLPFVVAQGDKSTVDLLPTVGRTTDFCEQITPCGVLGFQGRVRQTTGDAGKKPVRAWRQRKES